MAILINFFDNVILQAISEEIVPKVSFFKDRYFPTGAGDIFKANEVLTEYRSGDRKLAAFVDQKAGDIPIGRRSYEVHSYKPAYIAPSRLLTLDELTKRGFGEALYFSKAYGKYALRSNGIRTTGDALSMLWTVANNSMSGDASLALAATSLAADVAPLLLNKYLGSDSPVTTALTEAAKNYNGGTVLSSWQDGVLTDTGTPLYVLPPRDTGRTLSEILVSAYQNTPVPGGNGGSSPQFVFAPNITITGDADRQQIASIMEDEYEKFKAFMDKYNRENNRTRYA